MLELNLPSADIRLERRDGRLFIWDFVRRRWVTLTPEEWVRQHFSHWMTEHLGYPLARLGHEISLELNGMQRRADAVFYDREGRPLVIVEFKAPHIAISQKTFDQISRYNMVMQVPYLIISNGLQHFCLHVREDGMEFLREIPRYGEICGER
jgi:predicted type IV restriction endonuclease